MIPQAKLDRIQQDDVQLAYAYELLRGQKSDPAFPANPDKAVLNQ